MNIKCIFRAEIVLKFCIELFFTFVTLCYNLVYYVISIFCGHVSILILIFCIFNTDLILLLFTKRFYLFTNKFSSLQIYDNFEHYKKNLSVLTLRFSSQYKINWQYLCFLGFFFYCEITVIVCKYCKHIKICL